MHIGKCFALFLSQSFIVKRKVIGTRHCNWAKRIDGLNKSFPSSIELYTESLRNKEKKQSLELEVEWRPKAGGRTLGRCKSRKGTLTKRKEKLKGATQSKGF